MKSLYHLTDVNNVAGIIKEGLKSGTDGRIYLFDKKTAAGFIAKNQLFLRDFALFKVDPAGITSKFQKDNVAELSAKYQFFIKQKTIKPEFIEHINNYAVQ